jgi:multiple sugar transport system ATP-binding protein
MFVTDGLSVNLDNYDYSGSHQGDAWFGIRPEHVVTGAAADGSDASLEVTAEVVDPLGSDTLVLTRVGGAKFWLRMDGQSAIKSGDRLRIGISAKDASIFDADNEQRL